MVATKVLIIGAGAAGLACATKLVKNGFDNVLVLESENRIGGRILTLPFADNVIDLGAEWCHGEENNVVYELVVAKGKQFLFGSAGDYFVTAEYIRSNGEVLSDELVERLRATLANIFRTQEEEMRRYKGSLDQFVTTEFKKALGRAENKDINYKIAMEFLENFKKFECSEYSGRKDEVSASGFKDYWLCQGDYLLNWKGEGYHQFIKLLLEVEDHCNDYGMLKDKIIVGMRVEQIRWKQDGNVITVTCENSKEIYSAEHVVVTISLGVLKERLYTLFQPNLPKEKTISIENLGFGNACKIFMEFSAQFWSDDWTGFCTLWRPEDYKTIHRTKMAWLKDIFGFYCVTYQPRLLLAWIVGPNAVHMESLQKSEIVDGCMYLLRRFLPSMNIPIPVSVETTRWFNNRSFRGSYSFRSMRTEKTRTSARALADPLTKVIEAADPRGRDSKDSLKRLIFKPILLFAGEATSDHYYSTVHGAVESGWREADRLIGYYSYNS